MPTIIYKQDCENVDWATMKATLIKDNFDNSRTSAQYETSFRNSTGVVIAYADEAIIGIGRVLSDGICNAYVVDVWTYTPFRKQGIAREMLNRLLTPLHGQHIYLFTDDMGDFYEKLGFIKRDQGYEKIMGQWLVNRPNS